MSIETASDPQAPLSLAGQTIEKYHIHSKLGSGRLGAAYKARDSKLNRLVVLKLLPAEMRLDDDAVENFLADAMAASELDHPNICTIYEILETADEQLIIVMKYYEGESLDAKLAGRREALDVNREAWGLRGVPAATTARAVAVGAAVETDSSASNRNGVGGDGMNHGSNGAAEEAAEEGDGDGEPDQDRLPDNPVIAFEDAMSIARQIGEGLAAAHAEGIFHRAIKPENVFVTKQGQVVLLDFGVAQLADGSGSSAHYMSPEQIKGERVDHQTDIWAAGAILYEMITGRQPFPGDEDELVLEAVLETDPADIENDEIRPILQKALVRDKHQRYASAGALVSDLDDVVRRSKEEEPPVEELALPEERSPQRLIYAAIALAVLVIIVLVIVF